MNHSITIYNYTTDQITINITKEHKLFTEFWLICSIMIYLKVYNIGIM